MLSRRLYAVGLLAATVTAQSVPSDVKIRESLTRARPAIIQHLRHSTGDVLALVCLAAVHDGVPEDEPHRRRAMRRLARTSLTGTYGAALRLLVLAADPTAFGDETLIDRDERVARDVKALMRNRVRGGFTYASGNDHWDLSNTQYAALGLRAAVSLGHLVPDSVWQDLALAVLDGQSDDGGFGYTVRNRRKRPYSSMTVAGIAVLEICRQHLPEEFNRTHEMERAIASAWRWMDLKGDDIGSRYTPSCLYFHYGLERAAVLSQRKLVGNRDWYRVGSGMLLEMQDAKRGFWRSDWEFRPGALEGPGSPVDTAFGILFLRRNFKRILPPNYPRMITLGPQSNAEEIASAAKHLVRRGPEVLPEVIKAMRSPVNAKRRAAAAALRALTEKNFGYDPDLDPAETGDAIKAAELWWLRRKK